MVDFIRNEVYSPTSGFSYSDPSGKSHTADEARTPSTGIVLEKQSGEEASVTYDVNVPSVPGTAVEAFKLLIKGNVKTVTINIKKTDQDNSFTEYANVHVNRDGTVYLPPTAFNNRNMLEVGVIQVIPTDTWDVSVENYIFTVELYGCYNSYSKSWLILSVAKYCFGKDWHDSNSSLTYFSNSHGKHNATCSTHNKFSSTSCDNNDPPINNTCASSVNSCASCFHECTSNVDKIICCSSCLYRSPSDRNYNRYSDMMLRPTSDQ